MGTFKFKSLLILNIETFLLFISFKLAKLTSKSFLQIILSQLYKIIINKHLKLV